MLLTSGRMIVGRDPPSHFVVADSVFELDIKDVKEFQGGNEIVSDKIRLMELSDASWTIRVMQSLKSFTYDFYADIHKFPDDLKSKSKAELSVSCGGKVVSTYDSGSVRDSQVCYYASNSDFEKYFVDNAITLNCRLVIFCEGDSKLRHKFYDPLPATKSVLDSVSDMLGDPTFADFTFIVDGHKFRVHMNILAAASPVMRKMFTAGLEEAKTKECTFDAISYEIFGHLLRFIYRREIPEDINEIAKPLYEAAHYYEIGILKKICLREIHDSLSLDNAMEALEWLQPYDLEEIEIDAWEIVKRDILKIHVPTGSDPLPLETIRAIIKHREHDKAFWKKIEDEICTLHGDETSQPK